MSNEKHETVADIMAEIVGRDADCRQPVTDCHGSNAAEMRDALLTVKREKDGGVPKHCELAWAQMPYDEVEK